MIDLASRAELSLYAEIVREIRAVSQSEFLCGATARDLLLQHVHGIATERATVDVDFGVMVGSLDEFQAIRQGLVATGRFVIVTNMTRLRYGHTHNPSRGSKDAQDFRVIARSYFRLVGDERFYSQQHLLKRNDFDVVRGGAWMLGNDAGMQMHPNSTAVLERVSAITAEQMDERGALTLVSSMGGPVDENLELVRWFSEGLQAASISGLQRP